MPHTSFNMKNSLKVKVKNKNKTKAGHIGAEPMVNSHYHPRDTAHRIASADDNNPIV